MPDASDATAASIATSGFDDRPLDELRFVSSGVSLFAAASGTGAPIILLHGGLANHLACWRFAAPLAARHRLITPDLRGSGRSIYHAGLPGYTGPLTWDQLADDVAALIRQLGAPRAVIGGVSFGAGCAVRVALRHPALVAALAVLSPGFGGADLGLSAAQQAAMQAMHAAGRRAPAEGTGVLYPLVDRLPEALRTRARSIFAGYDPASVAETTAFLASGAQPFATGAELAAIEAPVLLVPGTDAYHPRDVAEVYQRHLPRCVVRDLDDTGYAAAIAELALPYAGAPIQ